MPSRAWIEQQLRDDLANRITIAQHAVQQQQAKEPDIVNQRILYAMTMGYADALDIVRGTPYGHTSIRSSADREQEGTTP